MLKWEKKTTPFPPGAWLFGKEQLCYVSGDYTIGKLHAYAWGILYKGRALKDKKRSRFERSFKTLKEAKAEAERIEARKH